MRIGFDAKRALNNFTGLGNHARILLNALMRDFPENDYLLYSPKANARLFNELGGQFKIYLPGMPRFGLWRSWGITSNLVKDKVNIYHGLSNELPFNIHRSPVKTVVTIHDLIFLKHKEQSPFIDRQIYTVKTKYAAKHADKIIAVSNETKRDLMENYRVAEDRIEVIYPSVDKGFWTTDDGRQTTAVQKYNLPDKFILNVGSFFPRKNQKTLIEAFDLIKDKVQEDLVLIGSNGTSRKEIEELILRKKLNFRVRIVPGVSNEDMPAIYRAASVFVFPSLLEGFGAPVLEALFSKTPVITTKGGAMEEAGGTGSLYINPSDAEEMAAAILKIFNDRELGNRMIESGYGHAQTMTDTIFAAKTMKVYREIS